VAEEERKATMGVTPLNLFQDIPESLQAELIEQLVAAPFVRIERIVSRGHSSPPGFWSDQDEHEWVVVLAGQAQLQIEGRKQPVVLGPGDTCNLPAHMKHRVAWTVPDQDTIWLAVFWKD
jgi:cupin 2 domain-containing protein